METPDESAQPNQFSEVPIPRAAKSSSSRKSAFNAIGWIGVVMGGLGFLTAEFSLANPFIQPMILEFQKSVLRALPAKERDAQIGMQQDIVNSLQESLGIQLFNAAFKLIVEVCLIVGSVFVLKRVRRTFAVWAFVGAIVSDAATSALQVYLQFKMSNVMAKGMNEMMRMQGNANAPDMSQFMKMMMIVAAIFGIVIFLGKIGFYGWAISFLNRESTRQEFDRKVV